MFKATLNQKQQELSIYRQLTLAASTVVHLCVLYLCIFLAPVASGANSFVEFLYDCLNEIINGGESKKAAVIFIIMLLASSIAIITVTILYLRKNYILATETSRGLLILMICYILAYYGFALFAALSCFVWLLSVRQFYKSVIKQIVRRADGLRN